jgi:hypothetical protein
MTCLVKPDLPWVSIRVKGAMHPTVDRLTSSQQVKDGSFSVVVAARSSDYPSSSYDVPLRYRTSSEANLGGDFTSPVKALIIQVSRRFASITTSNAVSG